LNYTIPHPKKNNKEEQFDSIITNLRTSSTALNSTQTVTAPGTFLPSDSTNRNGFFEKNKKYM